MNLDALLPPGSTRRSAAIGAAVFVAVLVYTQLLMPGAAGAGRGTPVGILFRGVVLGMVSSLTAAGIILVYRTLRIINFAQTAVGAAGAVLVFELVRYSSVPFPVAFALGLLLGGIVGLLFDLAFGRRFFNAPRLVLTVVTIAAATFLGASAEFVRRLPFFPPLESRSVEETFNSAALLADLPLRGFTFHIGGFSQPFGFVHLFAIEVAVIALVGLFVFFRFTKAGIALRAMAENSERASLLGINVGMLSTLVWVIAGVLSAASVTTTGLLTTPAAAQGVAPAVLLPALAAAVVGRMRSFPITVAAAVGIAVLSEATAWSIRDGGDFVSIGLFVLVGSALLVQRRRRGRSESGVEASWEASREPRGIPRELADIGVVRYTRWGLIGIGLIAVLVFPFTVSAGASHTGGLIALNGIVLLSLVVLTGWAGQVSLGQFGFVAVGAIAGGSFSQAGIPFWFAAPAGAAVAGAFAVLIGLPALRIRGLFLGITTFAFAAAVYAVVSSPRYFGELLPRDVERPSLLFVDFDDERSMYFLSVACLVLAMVAVANMRRSRVGRILIASRENEANLQSFGVNAVRTKLLAFAVSGSLAGFAGAVIIHHQRGLSSDFFFPATSVELFVVAVIGGIGSIGGAVIGAAYAEVLSRIFENNQIFLSILALLPLIVLYAAPGGLVSLLTQVRDSMLRIVAQRRQIVVPSLFADYDPEALEKRLVVLADPLEGGGLAALAPDQRFALASDLYEGQGTRLVDKVQGAKSTAEAAAIGAAAEGS